MTAERSYRCNLCHDTISAYAGAVVKDGSRAGVGCHFKANGEHTFVLLRDAEHHLCQRCIESVCENARNMNIGQACPH